MAKDKNCSACSNLEEYSPDFVVNGVTDTVAASLKNDTGFNPSSGRNDCQDLNDANDCLIGNMVDEIDAYEVCDWKTYMTDFVYNLWTTLKAVITTICGLWVHVENSECQIKGMYDGAKFTFGEDSEGASKVVPGTGVDFSIRNSGSGSHSTDVTLRYIAGGLLQVSGSLRTFTQSFYTAGGTQRVGNNAWNFKTPWDANHPDPIRRTDGGELLYEIRIKKSEFPQIKTIFNGLLHESTGVPYSARFIVFTAGRYAYGQHGWCDDDGTPSESGYSSGHLVPDGWIYCQARLLNQDGLSVHGVADGHGDTKQGSNFSPYGYAGIRMNRDAIDCSDDSEGD